MLHWATEPLVAWEGVLGQTEQKFICNQLALGEWWWYIVTVSHCPEPWKLKALTSPQGSTKHLWATASEPMRHSVMRVRYVTSKKGFSDCGQSFNVWCKAWPLPWLPCSKTVKRGKTWRSIVLICPHHSHTTPIPRLEWTPCPTGGRWATPRWVSRRPMHAKAITCCLYIPSWSE